MDLKFLFMVTLLCGSTMSVLTLSNQYDFISLGPGNERLFTEDQYEFHWSKWLSQYNRSYGYQEMRQRREVFKTNLDYITAHNRYSDSSYKLGMNQFGDMTHSEWSSIYLGYKPHKSHGKTYPNKNTVHLLRNTITPASVDWRKKGAVTPVKNQGQCGSCWSFSATGSMEGVHFIKSGKLVSLSEQQLVDCSSTEGDHGCFGGLMDDAFEYVINNHGIDTEGDYGYTARTGSCNTQKQKKHAVTFSSYSDVPTNDEQQLELAVANHPVSVAIEADQPDFQFYRSGIFNANCGTKLDHGVLAVGYGKQDDMNYWIVKNSWGESWGNKGYILIAKDVSAKTGQCGIAMQPSYPVA